VARASVAYGCALCPCAWATGLDGPVQVLQGVKPGDTVVVHSEKVAGQADSRIRVVEALVKPAAMISLAGRDILHSWGKFVLTGWAWAC
jgi:hypothetical protein